jgi:hypothetical protein
VCAPPAAMATALLPGGGATAVGEGWLPVTAAPFPSCPVTSRPQHAAEPSSRSAQVCASPALIATAVRPGRSATRDGDGCSRVNPDPSPTCPRTSIPQHAAEPSSRTAQVWESPALIATAVRPGGSATGDGDGWSPVTAPFPSCPFPSAPQQAAEPSSRTAQVCRLPALIATAVRPGGSATGDGSGWTSVRPGPFPSCPSASYPQQTAEPSSRIAQACSPPAAIETARRPDGSATGEAVGWESVIAGPLPSCPRKSDPQQAAEPSASTAHE